MMTALLPAARRGPSVLGSSALRSIAATSSATPATSSSSSGIALTILAGAKTRAFGARWFCDEKTPKWHARYPHRYFDFAAFRKALADKKSALSEAEYREVRREYAPHPPEGWTVLHFLEQMKFGDGAEEVAALFERWEDFISQDWKDLMRIRDMTLKQRRRLNKHLTLFNHGLWPAAPEGEFQKRFKGLTLKREGQPWTDEEDKRLLELCDLYDVNFGDPWIYLAWELQRRERDVRDQYVKLVVRPKEQSRRCELAITKASKPLLMNRQFRMLPPDLYIVPSDENFKLASRKSTHVGECGFNLPEAFRAYRQDEIF
jgi:hypothetical protein